MFVVLCLLVAPPDTWALLDELRATRAYGSGELVVRTEWSDVFTPGVREDTYKFFGDDAIWTTRDPRDDWDHTFLPTPQLRRARVGPYQVQNSGNVLQAAVSTSGYDFGQPIPDYRQLGLLPSMVAFEQGAHRFLRDLVPLGTHPEMQRDGDGALIRTQMDVDGTRLVLWQDPARGGHVVRSQLWRADQLSQECRVTLQQHGRDWFPGKVEYLQTDGQDLQPLCTVHVTHAKLDQAETQAITVEDAGVAIGTNVTMVNSATEASSPIAQRRSLHGWDGHAFVTIRELHQLIVDDAIQRSPSFDRALVAARLAREHGETHRLLLRRGDPSQVPSKWRAYTVSFADRFGFNEKQRQQALLICGQAEKRAEQMKRRFVAKWPKSDAARAAAIEAELADRELPTEALVLVQAVSKRTELDRELAGIFSDELQPRLDRLVTRRQRTTGGHGGD